VGLAREEAVWFESVESIDTERVDRQKRRQARAKSAPGIIIEPKRRAKLLNVSRHRATSK